MKNTADLSYGFLPDALRARQLDQRMRLQLADSLDYLRESIATQWDKNVQGLAPLIEQMRAGAAYPPSTFGLYYETANALLAGEQDDAMTLLSDLCAERPLAGDTPHIFTLDELQPPSAIGRYQRLMDTDPRLKFRIKSPSPESGDAFRTRVEDAQQRMQLILPSLAGEMANLIRQIILVIPDDASEVLFGSGSCYMLWGALLLNIDAYENALSLLEALAHEEAHTLLFGFAIDEPLVLNDADEVYRSPLREDLRPIDGIYHAAYVSARMHWTMTTVLQRGALNPEETAIAKASCEENRENFFQGYETVVRHGRLSDTGKEIMAGAYDYMKASRADCGQQNRSDAAAH